MSSSAVPLEQRHVRFNSCRNFATLGAAAVILRIAFDHFVRNLVHLFDGQTVDSTQVARLARTEIYRSRESPIGYQSMCP